LPHGKGLHPLLLYERRDALVNFSLACQPILWGASEFFGRHGLFPYYLLLERQHEDAHRPRRDGPVCDAYARWRRERFTHALYCSRSAADPPLTLPAVRRHVRCADCRCERAGNVTVGAPKTSRSVRRSCRNVESAYLTLVACRRVEAGRAGIS